VRHPSQQLDAAEFRRQAIIARSARRGGFRSQKDD
jgi:hypothetical protein